MKSGDLRLAGVLWAIWKPIRPILAALILFFAFRALLLEAFQIPTSSMESALLPGDFVLVNKAVFGSKSVSGLLKLPGWEDPKRGDIVVFQPPHDPERNYVKRVIGIPGDTVEMRDKQVFINGGSLQEDYLSDVVEQSLDVSHSDMSWQETFRVKPKNTEIVTVQSESDYRPSRDNWGPLFVPGDKFFVLGDNREDSEDSRYWGFVSRDSMEGKAWLIYYSIEPGYQGYKSWLKGIRWERVGQKIG